MENKKILAKLVKIANNQQLILTKLAQSAGSAGTDLTNFIKYQLVSWSLPHEVAAKESHTAEITSDSNHFDVNLTLILSDKNKKSVVDDPNSGFGHWLQTKFDEAAKNPNSKWKALNGYTAKFNVTAN